MTVTLEYVASAGKMGLQHSARLHYAETAAGKSRWTLQEFFSTVVLGMTAVGTALALASGLALLFFGEWEEEASWVLLCAVPLVLTRVVASAFNNILRAQERSGAAAVLEVVKRYVALLLVVSGLLLIAADLRVFFLATVVAELLVVALWAFKVVGISEVRIARFSWTLLKAMVLVGIPMLGFEVAGRIGEMADRYIILYLLGDEAVGVYSAAFNICMYLSRAVVASLTSAAIPMYLRIWNEDGREETRAFLERTLGVYVLFGVPIAAGFSLVSGDVITLLARPDYAKGAAITGWVVSALFISGGSALLGAGLYIEKRTLDLLTIVSAATALNIGLNFVLIPALGIIGAAVATLISSVVSAGGIASRAFSTLPLRVPWREALRCGLAATGMGWVVLSLPSAPTVGTLLLRVITGAVVYGALALALEPLARLLASSTWSRFRGPRKR